MSEAPRRHATRGPRLEILDYVPHTEIMHYADSSTRITSRHRRISVTIGEIGRHVSAPRTAADWALPFSRIARRALRTDKCNVVPVGRDGDFVLVREVPVHASRDGGRTWERAYALPAGLARHGPERQRAGPLRLKQPAGGVHEGASQITVMVAAGIGAFSFAHGITIISYLSAVQISLTAKLRTPI